MVNLEGVTTKNANPNDNKISNQESYENDMIWGKCNNHWNSNIKRCTCVNSLKFYGSANNNMGKKEHHLVKRIYDKFWVSFTCIKTYHNIGACVDNSLKII